LFISEPASKIIKIFNAAKAKRAAANPKQQKTDTNQKH